jgi:hypothetical protein
VKGGRIFEKSDFFIQKKKAIPDGIALGGIANNQYLGLHHEPYFRGKRKFGINPVPRF